MDQIFGGDVVWGCGGDGVGGTALSFFRCVRCFEFSNDVRGGEQFLRENSFLRGSFWCGGWWIVVVLFGDIGG